MHTGENAQSSVARDSFVVSSMDQKMIIMLDELGFIREEQVICSRGVLDIQNLITAMHEKLGHVIQVTKNQTSLMMSTLAYKSIDQEARSRRNTLIFRGFFKKKRTL